MSKRAVASEDSAAMHAGLAVGMAAAAYGVSYGALAVAAGLDIWQTCVMSLLMFTGGSQFALIGVIAKGGRAAGPPAIASAAILGIRNGIYGVRVAPIIGGPWWKRVAAAWVTIDETTAVATNQPTKRSQRIGLDDRRGNIRRLAVASPSATPNHRRGERCGRRGDRAHTGAHSRTSGAGGGCRCGARRCIQLVCQL